MAHEIDYQIFGDDMQFVEVELDPGEAVISEAGAMMYMREGIKMEAVFSEKEGGIVDKLFKVGKRMLTGESMFLVEYKNESSKKARTAFAAPYPGKIIPVDLKLFGTLLCQKDSFLCAAKALILILYTKIRRRAFGGEGSYCRKSPATALCLCTPAARCTNWNWIRMKN